MSRMRRSKASRVVDLASLLVRSARNPAWPLKSHDEDLPTPDDRHTRTIHENLHPGLADCRIGSELPPALVLSNPRRGRVLIVDDEILIDHGLRRALKREHDVLTLTDAREATRRIRDGERFDVILCDFCTHVNATVVGHAFYLMTLGGKNVYSKVVVRNPIGWNTSERLWVSMLAKVITPAGYRPIVAFDYLTLARQQLASAMFYPKEVANAVGCAWEAVEVFPQGTTQKVTGLACTKIAPIECSVAATAYTAMKRTTSRPPDRSPGSFFALEEFVGEEFC